ncbi:protein kinase domain-containing protein [Umezawaea sp. Da 62-37]|uniref:protein kinase domain-containing protein n=1 Tax=Umezawaea sp. Da 62-37 TaxID=3075927 RepID=UPI0028F70C9A|nr:protein kinase [Umezawaea sp. Da 62-37]WNV91446.1 protein kinase [Umezawaea sp. Da 62-37]
MLITGQLLAERYRLTRRIAVGGMGEVWEAEDTRLDRNVAVKVLKADLSGDAEFLTRFRIEARTTASLNHPGIAAVHDYGETASMPDGPEDTAYLVMELVEGEPLAAVIARGRLTVDRTLDVLQQAGTALQAAHERGLVHRDVKPGNILVTPTGKVKITDFGIAKAADAAPVTRNGMVMGTAHYIAPEQALGHDAEPASDVYALAVCGYECLTGHRPFRSENAVTVAMMHIRDIAPPLPPDVPAGPRALIEATLVKDPRQRYRNGGEFAAAVAAIRAGQPLPAPSGLSMANGPSMATGPVMTHPGLQMSHPASQPGFPPVRQGMQSGQHPLPINSPHTGNFRPLPAPPRPQGKGKAALWVMVGLLVVALIVLGVFVLRAVLDNTGSAGSDGQPGTTGARPAQNPGEVAQPSASGQLGPNKRVVRIEKSDFLDLPVNEVTEKLAKDGLLPESQTNTGEQPREQPRCLVSDVAPSGDVAIGSRVKVTCVPT